MKKLTGSRPPAGYPNGYDPKDPRKDVFDPALRHHPCAFVKSEQTFEDPDTERAYLVARKTIIDRALAAIALRKARDALVVRGSVALERWFGGRARRPKDIDLVVQPASWGPDSAPGKMLLEALRGMLSNAVVTEQTSLAGEVTLDSIWTYERAEGRRLLIPWLWEGTRRDQLQIDVVFAEPLVGPTQREQVGEGFLAFASPEESLAWKLLWLETDGYPQGKDLYDAVLLAESTSVRIDFLRKVFVGKDLSWSPKYTSPDFVLDWQVDWQNLLAEYPGMSVTAGELQTHLCKTLRLLP
jgi:hypothetical protein